MKQATKAGNGFLLRLPTSLKLQAAHLAEVDGVSLNQFIVIALAEKLAILSKDSRHKEAEAVPSEVQLRATPHLIQNRR